MTTRTSSAIRLLVAVAIALALLIELTREQAWWKSPNPAAAFRQYVHGISRLP